jgi:hypothetical protein
MESEQHLTDNLGNSGRNLGNGREYRGGNEDDDIDVNNSTDSSMITDEDDSDF